MMLNSFFINTKVTQPNKKGLIAFFSKLFFIGFILISLFCFPGVVSAQVSSGSTTATPYTFTLNTASTTSAGVYRAADSVLVRTLWTTVKYNAGTYNITWDGKDDLGNPAPAGNYVIKVMSSNVQYTWQGVIGNTSDNDTGSTVHLAQYYYMTGMTIVNSTAYYCQGYSEQRPSVYKFSTSLPQRKIDVEAVGSTTANIDIAVNDGTTVYWAAYDPYSVNNTFVYGSKISNDSHVNFAGSIGYQLLHGISYNAISYLNQAGSYITGLAVQKTGNLLFIARKNLNQLSVLDKTTGTLLQTISINQPKSLAVDLNDNLIMVSDSNIVTKYKVNTNGTLSTPLLTITSVLAPIALGVSPDNVTLAIADGAITSQQVKAFNITTGAPLWTLGTPGGYMQDATVNNNKFYFNDTKGRMYIGGGPGFLEFIAFQPNGSFWVNDPGNYRVQHYTATRQYIETSMALGPSYSTWADKNDNTRVGGEYLEFKINNSQPLTGTTGWQLVKNWGANVSAAYDHTGKFSNVITLTSKGVSRTFGFLQIATYYYLVEFQSNNMLRFTGIKKFHCNIAKDGSILTDDLLQYPFLGFDNLNNPIWSTTPIQLANISTITNNTLAPNVWVKNAYLTSSGKIIFYDYGIYYRTQTTNYTTGFHLGAIQKGGTAFLWQTALATHRTYSGLFPDPSHYDIGNQVNYNAGSSVMVFGQNVVTGYHGEFWKSSQTNKYNHYWDNGLAIGQFGITRPETVGEAPPMSAGNALTPQLVYGTTPDELFLYHGDESIHGGMHKWRISGLSTIAEQDVPITYPSPQLNVVVPGNDLMVNLPYSTALLNNTAGWTISPTAAVPGVWTINTNNFISGTQNDPDVSLTCTSLTGNFSLKRDLGNNSGMLYWALSGQINYFMSNPQGNMTESFDVLDSSGKIIARLTNKFNYATNGNSTNTIYWNNKVLFSGLSTLVQVLLYKTQPITISAVNNLLTINYAGYTLTAPMFDPTASISAPKTMSVDIAGGFNPTPKRIDLQNMRFYTKKTNQTLIFNPTLAITNGNPALTLVASASSNLPVTFTVISGPGSIIGNTLSLSSTTGIVIVQASQNGNAVYNSALPVLQTFIVSNLKTIRIDL